MLIFDVRRFWCVISGELTGPRWEMTFYPKARLIEMQLANQLGGKGYVLLRGRVADVEASVERGAELAGAALVRQVVIPLLHDEMGAWIGQTPRDQG